MITIREMQNNNEIYFENIITEKDKIIFTNQIYYRTFVRERNNTTYLMLYDFNMVPVSEVFNFLNFNCSSKSIHTRIKSLQALKLLYCYQSIIHKDLENFTVSDINGLKIFLKGLSLKGQAMSFELLSSRNNETINSYLSVYRQFLSFLKKTNKPLMSKSSRKTLISHAYSEVDYKIEQFSSSERVAKRVIEVPRYISVEEFQNIIIDVRSNYTVREEIIIRLMFQCGLRIGEVLGMTADDLLIEQIDDLYVPVLYFRNRVSDQRFQYAKGLMKVTDKRQYQSDDYNTLYFAYRKIVIPEDLYNLINFYIEKKHIEAREENKENYYSCTIADRVRKSEDYEDDNYYIFINSLGRPLSYVSWNTIIKSIFSTLGIHIDTKTKKHNLNHRFRHGFAMFNVQYLNCNELELQDRMRHRSLQSVACYFRPTTSDAIKIKTAFADTLNEIFPDLQGGWSNDSH